MSKEIRENATAKTGITPSPASMKVFESEEFGRVRIIDENGEPLFCGSDVARALGYSKPNNAISAHCKGALKRSAHTSGGMQEMSFITESDVYNLILSSKLEGAKRFKHWIMNEITQNAHTSTDYQAGIKQNNQKSAIRAFNNPEFGDVRIIEENGKPLFCGADVARALGYARPNDALSAHCRYTAKRSIPHPQNPDRQISMSFIPEGDLYRLIVSSNLPSAERFERWVFDTVLPSIRKHGGYMCGQESMPPMELLSRAVLYAQSQIDEKNAQIASLTDDLNAAQPKIIFADAVTASDTSIPMGSLAKLLRQNSVDTGRTRLFAWMRENGYPIKKPGPEFNLPTQFSMDRGLFEVEESVFIGPDSKPVIRQTTRVTGKGQRFFIEAMSEAHAS